jgi:hypothetical protein
MSHRIARRSLGLLVCVGFLLSPASAGAAGSHLFKEIFGSANQPSFGQTAGVTVIQSNGDLLVIDTASNKETISRWTPSGESDPFPALGTNVIDGKGSAPLPCTPPSVNCDRTPLNGLTFGGPGNAQVAVDESGGPTDGNIYVPQFIHPDGITSVHVVYVFDEDGNYIGLLENFKEGPAGEGSLKLFDRPCGVAVDPDGNVYVGDLSGEIHKYEPSGPVPVDADSTANFPYPPNCAIAAGAGPTDGFIFPARNGGKISKLSSSTGAEIYEVDPRPTTTVGIDPVSGHLYAAKEAAEIAEFDVSAPLSAEEIEPPIALAGSARGVAVNGLTGDVYVIQFGSDKVEVFAARVSVLPLTVKKAGTGKGTVKSKPPGINCESSCVEETTAFEEGEPVELKAKRAPGSEFIGWTTLAGDTGTCTGSTSPCEVSLTEATELKAEFELLPPPTVTGVSPSEGPTGGGNLVEITGTNFAEATKVEFGASVVEAPFIEKTATKLKLKAPGHSAETVDVIVTTASGVSVDTPDDDYIYVGDPHVTGLSPSAGPVAGGNEVRITGTNLAEATKVEFGSAVIEAPFIENTATGITVTAPAHSAGTVSVRVTTPGGTSLSFPTDDYAYLAPAALPPVPEAGSTGPLILPPPQALCLVPKLKGLGLAGARRTLARAHCKTGEIVRPRARRRGGGSLVVGASRPGAGASLPAGAEVDLTLVARAKQRQANHRRGGSR